MTVWLVAAARTISACGPTPGDVDAVTDAAARTDATAATDVAGLCTITRVDRAVQRCCQRNGPYSAFNNCTTFSNTFHNICDDKGIMCRSLTASCAGAGVGHAFNMVHISTGEWCFVEPQASRGNSVRTPCFADPDHPTPAALCAIMDVSLSDAGTCPCTIGNNSSTPLPSNRDPLASCATSGTFTGRTQATFDACSRCCVTNNSYHRDNTTMGWLRWQCECTAACYDRFHPDGARLSSASRYNCAQYSATATPASDAGLSVNLDASVAPPLDAAVLSADASRSDAPATDAPRRCPSQQHNREFDQGACVQSWLDDMWYQCTNTGWVAAMGSASGPAGRCTVAVPRM